MPLKSTQWATNADHAKDYLKLFLKKKKINSQAM